MSHTPPLNCSTHIYTPNFPQSSTFKLFQPKKIHLHTQQILPPHTKVSNLQITNIHWIFTCKTLNLQIKNIFALVSNVNLWIAFFFKIASQQNIKQQKLNKT